MNFLGQGVGWVDIFCKAGHQALYTARKRAAAVSHPACHWRLCGQGNSCVGTCLWTGIARTWGLSAPCSCAWRFGCQRERAIL
jgi:hypothetical protein